MRKHARLAIKLACLIAIGASAQVVELELMGLQTAITLAAVDGAPLSGAWS